ncbi:hypothetical protein ACFY5J_02280 [Peribacillus butanolivorans]|uniref:hypothetical protein n=1 Tax=Peribacillus butanolivorans TaxID=421767 RepID=UPI00367DF038
MPWSVSLTYTEMQIPVPQPDGITNLPPFVYFDVDNRFTVVQRQRIRDAIRVYYCNGLTTTTRNGILKLNPL